MHVTFLFMCVSESGCKEQRGDPLRPEIHMVLSCVAGLVLDTADCL